MASRTIPYREMQGFHRERDAEFQSAFWGVYLIVGGYRVLSHSCVKFNGGLPFLAARKSELELCWMSLLRGNRGPSNRWIQGRRRKSR